ncbi:MAG: serine/threonine-protein kinase, partial [Planctomycetota bacterium]
MSPGNVIVGYDGTVKVLDFGVARINETQGYQTQTGTLRGKFAYMSPEQTRGEELDARSDVFSFGTVLYELLTGSNCFRDKNPISTLERVQGMRPVPPSRALRIIPKDVDRILAQCLSKDRRRRFPDAEAVAEAIEDYLSKRGFDGQTALVEYMATTFSWEQHEEASELAREEEEVALMEVVEFVPDLTNDGLDSHRIAVTTNEEASSSEVRQVKVGGDAGGAVFEEDGGAARSSANVLSEDMPLKRGRAVQASSLLAEAEDGAEASAPGDADIDANAAAGLASPSAPRQFDADEEPTAHIAAKLAIDTAADVAPLPPPEASPPWYANTMAIAGVTAIATLSVALLIFSQQSGGFKSDGATPIAPVTIRLPGESTGESSNQPLAAVSASTA